MHRDRLLAAIEIPALGIWLGALAGFAFASAPVAFRIVAPLDLARFAAVTAGTLAILTAWGAVLGTLALAAALLRAADRRARRSDGLRAALVAAALALTVAHERLVVPRMLAATDYGSPAYHALHAESTRVYGASVLAIFAALVLAALRGVSSRSTYT